MISDYTNSPGDFFFFGNAMRKDRDADEGGV